MGTYFQKIHYCFLAILITGEIFAGVKEFDFADPKGVNAMSISLNSELEPIIGSASGISGTLRFDPDNPKSLHGTISVVAKEIQTTNQRMTKVLHSVDWINVEDYPMVEFNIRSAQDVSKKGDTRFELLVSGEFTLKGVTKKIQAPITISYLPGKLSSRQEGKEGDLLVIRSEFSINRKDFDIKPDMGIATVANKIDIKVGIVGISPKN